MDIAYKGEHLFPGQLGQFFIVLAFGAALLSCISYFYATKEVNKNDNSWLRLGRIAYRLNTASIIGMGVCLFYVIYNHYFEYHYAWSYTSRDLPVYYIVSGFWNGQEGGFLLWMFWGAVLGNVLIWKAKSWERPVMTIVALSQVVLGTMILGIELWGKHIGSSPFLLLRDAMADAPIFKSPEYLSFIKDGKGMNPSLQNYWMVIHPPVLFLGIASFVVPFAYATAGLWQKRYKEWISPVIPYALFSCMVLGTGVIMGSFWAYESLNFGGFWAWDPVENASIFAWLILVGGLHVLVVYKNTGHSYFTATFLVMLSFVLVWYQSFLARSGVLGESSVHAFTDLGMFWQLVIGTLIFLAIMIYLLVSRWKELPISKKDEETYSREFWMFVGAVFLGLSCFHLLLVTSIPVWNLAFGTKIAPPTDVKIYNVVQAAFAVLVTLLSGFVQFLKYKKTDVTRFFITTSVYLLFAALVTALIVYATGFYKLHVIFIVLMLCSVYSIVANAKIFADAMKGKYKLAGSAVAHIGFGLMLVGALISAGTKKVVSENTTGERYSAEFEKDEDPRENILLYKNEPIKMGTYDVTFTGDTIEGQNHYFNINYQKLDADGKIKEAFTLRPKVIGGPGNLSSAPDTRHYLFHDLYTHITLTNVISTEPAEEKPHGEESDDKDYDAPVPHEIAIGDTMTYREGVIVLKGLNKDAKIQSIPLTGKDVAVGAQLEILTHGKKYTAEPIYLIKGQSVFDFGKKVEEAGLKLRFTKIIPGATAGEGKVEIMVYQQPESKKKFIVMKAIEFPYINFLWAGTIIMVIGFFMSILRRNKEVKVS